ncbi:MULTISPECIES: hypothetical protein [unclassified Mesorhizobium]|uniref:hypothetical protein n=1 Tax=unclassified Mesorhizobium TaxID=325217 RepID=UPI001129CAE6|nr:MULTISPECIES: hypothetical protein [unclassified Mesorhizobium]MBZ9699527.1 hypothetical protein [Mesorhizobium sp. CO1-1-3]MBZ9945780.1 hypothetical protein [Mesorhizobium sp. BR1-1-11]TPJ08214.1 hypothetical protein FJ428_07865 [Mesorhizobium sp. B2-8-1]
MSIYRSAAHTGKRLKGLYAITSPSNEVLASGLTGEEAGLIVQTLNGHGNVAELKEWSRTERADRFAHRVVEIVRELDVAP